MGNVRYLAPLLVLLMAPMPAIAAGAARGPVQDLRPCFYSAARRYGVNPALLWSIAKIESGFNPSATQSNKNGSTDIGVMQINTAWLSKLRTYGISRAALFDPCVNIHVGAWILAKDMARHGNTWKAVGSYNAATPAKQLSYAQKVLRVAYAITSSGPARSPASHRPSRVAPPRPKPYPINIQ